MLRNEQLSILRDISQSVAFADDLQGRMGELIADGYVMKDGDLFALTAKGASAVEEHAASLLATLGDNDATSAPSNRLV